MGTATVIRSTAASGLTDAPLLKRDPILAQDKLGEILFLADFAFPWSYVGTTPIANGALVRDVAGIGDGSFVVAGAGPTIAGGGVDFTAVNTAGCFLQAPAAVAAAIAANSQNFLQWGYFKMPSDANWWTSTSISGTFLNWCTSSNYTAQPDICAFEPKTNTGVKQLLVRFQTGTGVATSLNYSPIPTGMTGEICQIAAWRNATEIGASIRTPTGRTNKSGARVTDTEVISGLQAKAGALTGLGTLDAIELAALNDLRLYRLGLGSPKTGGRDILTVLEQDYLAQAGRFS